MAQQAFDINGLRIASPCPMAWSAMKGDDRSRFCRKCELNVFNIAGMTSAEVEQLMAEREGGRVCARFYRRADGTVLTKDCPVGVRTYRKRVATLAGAAIAGVLSLFTISYGQKDKDAKTIDASKLNVTRSVEPQSNSSLAGSVLDPNGALVPNARIRLYQGNKELKKESASDSDGRFRFESLPAGTYEIRVVAVAFRQLIIKKLAVGAGEKLEMDLGLEIDPDVEVLIGVVGATELIDLSSNERKTVFTREMLDRMPGGRPF